MLPVGETLRATTNFSRIQRTCKVLLIRNACRCPLTCYNKGGVPAGDCAGNVLGDTPVDASVLLLLAVDDPQEEETARRQDDPVTLRAGVQLLAVLPPLDGRLRLALGLTVQCHRVVLWHYRVGRVLRDARRPELACNREAGVREGDDSQGGWVKGYFREG